MDAHDTVLIPSTETPDTEHVKGYDFNNGIDFEAMMASMKTTGFQATNLSLAIDEINSMISVREATVFLGFTSNMVSCGCREIIRYLAEHNLIDVIVTTAGGVEEDLIKCLAPTYMGNFHLDGANLRSRGLNRIGNLIVPNNNYVLFEEFLVPILDACLEEQVNEGQIWSPSKLINRFGKEIDNEESIWYWCHKNSIPVFCPALTDGSIGDMLYFHSIKHSNPSFVLDIVQDIRGINGIAARAKRSGQLILGGGTVKHHINNANLMRNGCDWSVFVNLGVEHEGSDSGAAPDEAVSWGKIRPGANCVKVFSEITLVLPMIVAQTFAKFQIAGNKREKKELFKEIH